MSSTSNRGHYRAVASEGAGGQFLVDQLTLSQPGGTHYPHPVLLAPQIFRPCDSPVKYRKPKFPYFCVVSDIPILSKKNVPNLRT